MVVWQVGEKKARQTPPIGVRQLISPLPALASLSFSDRPTACLCTDPELLEQLKGLPCPVWGDGFKGLEGCLQDNWPEFMAAAAAPFDPGGWCGVVYLCLPLSHLWASRYYQQLVANLKLNLEIGFDCQALDELITNNFSKVRQMVGHGKLTAHMPFMDLHPGATDYKIAAVSVERLRQAAHAAIELEARRAVFHLGYDPRLNRESEYFVRQVCTRLAPIMQQLQKAGCLPVIENVFEPTPDVCLAARQNLEQATGHFVGLCLDVGHAQAFNNTSLRQWWDAFSPYLAEMHLHDNPGFDDLHQAIGSGVVDFRYLGEVVKSRGQRPLLTAELRCEEAFWASMRALQELWGPANAD